MTEQAPSIGRIVTYKLLPADAEQINSGPGPLNSVQAGDELPAMMVRVFTSPLVNLQVFLDGAGTYWATSRTMGRDPGNWHWPDRV